MAEILKLDDITGRIKKIASYSMVKTQLKKYQKKYFLLCLFFLYY